MKFFFEKLLRFIGYNFNYYRIQFDDPRSRFNREQREKSYHHFKKFFKTCYLNSDKNIRNFAVKRVLENKIKEHDLFLEFGVYKGNSINQLADILKSKKLNIFGFDSFQGIDNWEGTNKTKGHYSTNGKLPKVRSNVKLIVGDIFETLPIFLEENSNKKIKFVHIDTDTYLVGKFILENIKNYLDKNAVIVFDELHNFSAWEDGEYKALQEVFDVNQYDYLAFGTKTNACIKLNL